MGPGRTRPARARVAFVVLVVVLGLGGVVEPAESAARLTLKPIVFTTAFGDQLAAERGTLTVPESRARRRGARIRLEVIRFPATGDDVGPPTVLLEGGPGQPGIDTAAGRRSLLIERLQRIGDVLVLDQRGVGESTPRLDCTERMNVAPGTELTYAQWIADLDKPSGRCAHRWGRKGVDLSSYNTQESADDVDDLRDALGAERINLWGQSYGTQLALEIIRRHPERVARAVLHGVAGPDQLSALPRSVDKVLHRFLRLAERQSGFGGLADGLDQILADLETAPAVASIVDPRDGDTIEVEVGPFEVRFVIHFAILGTRSLMQSLPAWIVQMRDGDFSTIATMGLELRRWEPFAMRMAVVCTTGTSAARQRKSDRQAPRTTLGSLMRIPDICPAWKVEPLGDEILEPVVADVPVLLISGTLDSVTPVTNAKAVARRLSAAEQLLLVGATHSDLVHGDPRILDIVADYFEGKSPPVRRLVMPAWELTPAQ